MTASQSSALSNLGSGAWLTRQRVTGYLTLLAIANLLALALAICRAHGWFMPPEPHFSTEFLSFYAAGRLVDAGQALLVYAPGIPAHAFIASFHVPPAHQAMEQALTRDPKIFYFAFFYPPVYWLLCAPLAHLPFLPAYLLWVAATGGLLGLCLRRLAGGWRKLWPALAYLAVIENAAVGENAFLSAALVGFGVLNLERRPQLAGACFGALCYKPHFMLPVVLFLLAGGHMRTLISAALTGAALGALSALLFGWQSWIAYFIVIVPHAEYVFNHAGVSYGLQVTPGAALRLLGASQPSAALAQTCAALFAAYGIFATRRASPDLRAAMLTASFPLLLSVMLIYDLTVCGLAILFMLRECERTGYLAWDKTALAAMFALPLVAEIFAKDLHFPLSPLINIAFMALLLRPARLRISAPLRY